MSNSAGADTVRALQQKVLAAALTQEPLEGQTRALQLPEVNRFLEAEEKIVSRENLVGEIGSEIPILFLAPQEITQRAARGQTFNFLRFLPTDVKSGEIRLTLQALVATESRTLPISAVIVTFTKAPDGSWRVQEPPAMLGY